MKTHTQASNSGDSWHHSVSAVRRVAAAAMAPGALFCAEPTVQNGVPTLPTRLDPPPMTCRSNSPRSSKVCCIVVSHRRFPANDVRGATGLSVRSSPPRHEVARRPEENKLYRCFRHKHFAQKNHCPPPSRGGAPGLQAETALTETRRWRAIAQVKMFRRASLR